MTPEQQLEKIKRGTVEIIQEKELLDKLRKEKQLIVKAGFDPTAPDIHLGHTVLLRKLRHFQECGHKVIFLIGDATALVGDPSGQNVTRKMMTPQEVKKNAETYENQIKNKNLLLTNPDIYAKVHNSDWFVKYEMTGRKAYFTFEEFVDLASRYTITRLLERDDFQKRLKANKPISYLETFYPLMQGYDSVRIAERFGSCDVELGGTDQKFNLLVGRELLKDYHQKNPVTNDFRYEPQVVMTMPLLEGTDGIQKMSKSLGNHIAINEPSNDMFGKIMRISDEIMWKYYELLTDENVASVRNLYPNPRDAKKNLAKLIVSQYHSVESANVAEQVFEQGVGKEERKDAPIYSISNYIDSTGYCDVPALLVGSGLVVSKSEARRKIDEGAVKLNDQPITDFPSFSSSNYKIFTGEVKTGFILNLGWKAIAIEIPETGGTSTS